MPRSTGTQTRSFVYDDAGRMTSATNPETGTVTYWYNADNTLWKKLDAKGQYANYAYDSKKRLTGTTTYKPGGAVSDQITYYWDVAPDGSPVAGGQSRMTAMSYTSNGWTTTASFEYAAPGGATSKTVGSSAFPGALTVNYTLDTYGRTTQVSATGMPNVYYSYGLGARQTGLAYDCVVPNDCTLVTGAQFDLAGRMTSVQRRTGSMSGTAVYETETRGYNVMGQLTNLNWSGPGGNAGLTYSYSSTMNNGQITGMTDSVSGETVSYQYDSLKRLVSATSQNWYQTYSYDGFSNLLSKTTNGSVVNYPVDPTTNRISNGNAGSAGMYDANGNMTGAPGTTLTYDPMNRAVTANVNGAVEQYGYDMGNRRLYKKKSDGTLEFMLYGVRGEKLGKYSVVHEWVISDQYPDGTYMDNIYPASQTFWFAGKVIFEGSVSSGVMPSRTDRLGSTSRNYYPYGESKGGAVPLDQVGFATYTRDSFSGLDYAVNRWSLPGMGRFGSADPYQASAGPGDPKSWNRYNYASGNPINGNDPRGLKTCFYVDGVLDSCEEDLEYGGAGEGGLPHCDELRVPNGACVETSGGGHSSDGFNSGTFSGNVYLANVRDADSTVKSAMKLLLDRVANDSECQKWLGVNWWVGLRLFSSELGVADFQQGFTTRPASNVTATTLMNSDGSYTYDGNSVFINANGYFYAKNAPSGALVGFGKDVWFGVGSSQFQLGTLLHEYGHWKGLPGFAADGGQTELQNSENAAVLANCGKVVNP